MRLVLASGSPRRADLLRKAEFDLVIEVPGVPEAGAEGQSASETAAGAAKRKCEAVSSKYPDSPVLGADTLVVLDGRALGKPRDLDEARQMLRSLSGRSHEVVTAVHLEHRAKAKRCAFTDTSRVSFKALDEEDIEAYLKAVHVLDKAGAYAVQERADLLGAEVEGSFSNVVGLPVKRVLASLHAWGYPS